MLSIGIFAKGISSSIKAYGVQELAVTKLNASLRAQNIFTQELSKSMQDEASALQQVTIFGDEAILQGQAFAMSMGVTASTIREVTPDILNFASAMGIDLQSAFRIVGQAAIGETGVLKRYGIVVDAAELKSRGFAAVLDTMRKNFSGMAEAVAKSGIGPMEQFKNLMGDFQEEIGAKVIPIINGLIATLLKLSRAMDKLRDQLKRVRELLEDTNVTVEEHNKLIDILEKNDRKAMEAFLLRVDKRLDGIQKVIDKEQEFADKIAAVIEREKTRLKEVQDLREETAKKDVKQDKERYALKEQLREIDLQGIIANIEAEIEEEETSDEKKKLLSEELSNFRRALKIEEAAQISTIQDSIADNLEGNLSDMILGEKEFGEGVNDMWKNLNKTILDMILEQVVAEKAAATIRLGVEAALGAAKSLAAHSSIPFIGIALGLAAAAVVKSQIDQLVFQGGTRRVPGAEGAPVQATVHGGEEIRTKEQQGREGSSNGMTLQIFIQGTFLEADETKWDRLVRQKLWRPLQKYLGKTGEKFSGS